MSLRRCNFGSGAVVGLGMVSGAVGMVALGRTVGWDQAWRALGVTPLQPPFFDMHVINDYAACALKGVDPYTPQACNVDSFNIPPTWLWLGLLGVDGSDSAWLSAVLIATAMIVLVLLLRGRTWYHGVIALGAIVSPSVMMGVERGNLDLLILAIVGSAALIYNERSIARTCAAVMLLALGVALKLFPMLCISLASRFSRQALVVACVLAGLSLIYIDLTVEYVSLIRRNVPTTFVLSYGYKAIFLGTDYLRREAGLSPIGLTDTWLPAGAAALILVCAIAVAGISFRNRREFYPIDISTAGTAFLFGTGIYCGTYLLGTNFIYRLMFLLLCLPQLLDWQTQRSGVRKAFNGIPELGLLAIVLGVLWLNGNADGHSTFLILPQLLDWLLFFCLVIVLVLNFLRTSVGSKVADRQSQRRPDSIERNDERWGRI
jgi:hypothetical protein